MEDILNNSNTRILKLNGTDLEQLNNDELFNFVMEMNTSIMELNPNCFYRMVYFEDETYMSSNDENVNDFFHGTDVTSSMYCSHLFDLEDIYTNDPVKDNYAFINNKVFKFIRIVEMKSTMLNELSNLGDYFINFKRISDSVAKGKLEMGRSQHTSSFSEKSRDIVGESSYHANEQMLEDVVHGKQALFSVECSLIISGESIDEVNTKIKSIIPECTRRGFKIILETVGIDYALENIAIAEKEPAWINSFPVNSKLLINLLPLHLDKLYPEGMRFYSQSGKGIFYDIFDNQNINYNVIVAGPSGSGKSFTIGAICYFQFMNNVKIINIERGDSMGKLGKLTGGVDLLTRFNPMMFKNTTFLKEFILSSIPEAEITKKEKGRLHFAIEEIDLSNINTFEILLDELDHFINDIKYYFFGILPYLSDEIFEFQDFSHVNIESLPEDVIAPFIIFVMEYVENLKGRRVLFLDEVHFLLKKNPEFVEQKFREARKKDMGIMAATHDFDEFIKSEVGKIIENCANTKILFNQACSVNEQLNSFDVENIKRCKTRIGEYSEFYLKTENFNKIVRYFSNPREYEVLTTNPLDNQRMDKFFEGRSDYFSFTETLDRWVEYKYAH
ncbi:hypothetical protein A9Q84_00285 [Halobacteriovorax marinus]|uniref:AAA+ ATPase domain-containing protein n=1 Tax=Halobacteriovorax marinus TaxID=97084 RepID=A0A1Y5FJV1_9BACT|nr:hypothetical protein A9Q84_00285 [Halobacteriovorax marinus]